MCVCVACASAHLGVFVFVCVRIYVYAYLCVCIHVDVCVCWVSGYVCLRSYLYMCNTLLLMTGSLSFTLLQVNMDAK